MAMLYIDTGISVWVVYRNLSLNKHFGRPQAAFSSEETARAWCNKTAIPEWWDVIELMVDCPVDETRRW